MNTSDPVITKDGSHTLFNERTGEHYHSVFGAIQESEHIFIRAGLGGYQHREKELQILEIGFGTGLNALLSLKWAEKQKQPVRYLGIEAFPLSEKILKTLNYTEVTGQPQALFLKMHNATVEQQISPFFSLQVIHKKFQDFQPDTNRFHVLFFDAFSPDNQPEMWTQEGFKKLFHSLVHGGILVTYSCKGSVKRALKAAGFQLEKLPGPPGKREFLRATAIKK
jgi:tRNA U34 5-methylaminomethyl-2-thiouridine-forming methyltransferase MnmC